MQNVQPQNSNFSNAPVYILGSGAVGLALAASLIEAGRNVTLVRTSHAEIPKKWVDITVNEMEKPSATYAVETVSLDQLSRLTGIIAVTAKAFANGAIADQLKTKAANDVPIVLMQNGLDIEQPFIENGFAEVYRCVLYVTSQKKGAFAAQFRSVKSSPIGVMAGSGAQLQSIVDRLHTSAFHFHTADHILLAVWQKVIFNAVFNTICPMLDTDNGIFVRDAEVAGLAAEVITECCQVAAAFGLQIDPHQISSQLQVLSKGSYGQNCSTLEDIKNGRETEIGVLNHAIVLAAKSHAPEVDVSTTKLMGDLTLFKAKQARLRNPNNLQMLPTLRLQKELI